MFRSAPMLSSDENARNMSFLRSLTAPFDGVSLLKSIPDDAMIYGG